MFGFFSFVFFFVEADSGSNPNLDGYEGKLHVESNDDAFEFHTPSTCLGCLKLRENKIQ